MLHLRRVNLQGCVEKMIHGQFLQQGRWQHYPYLKPSGLVLTLGARRAPLRSFPQPPQSLGPAVLTAKLNNQTVDVLIDTGASENFIDKELADRLYLKDKGQRTKEVLLATRQKEINIESRARADIEICGGKYRLQFGLMPELCADVILGRQVLSPYSEVTLCYGGSDPPLRIRRAAQLVLGVAAAKLKPREFLSS